MLKAKLLQTIAFTTIIAVATTHFAIADITIINGRDIKPRGASPVGEYGQIYKITVSPAKETSPAFKYRFTVEPYKTIPGNSVTHYLRSLGQRSLDSPLEYVRTKIDPEAENWGLLSVNPSDIPEGKLKLVSESFDSYINNHLKRATICRDTDWGIAVEDFRGRDCVDYLLPSVQHTQSMARVLMIQNRFAVMEGRYADAVERLRMTYQLGQNVNEMGFLVSSLVGVAEVGMANSGSLMLMSAQDAPNIYWALAELPSPVINLRHALRIEFSLPLRLFPKLLDIENAAYSDEEWKRLLKTYIADASEMLQMVSSSNSGQTSDGANSAFMLASAFAGYGSAKKRLIERGYAEASVKSMSVAQVILVDAAIDIKQFSDDLEKIIYLPAKEGRAANEKWEAEIRKQSFSRLGALVASTFSSAVHHVREAGLKVEAEINVLMAIESLRNHAAVHGKFPETLKELELPVRDNPITESPFNYSLEGKTAVITAQLDSGQLRRYEISLKK